MTDQPRWMQRLAQLIRPADQAATSKPAHETPLARFTDQLDALRTLAETATDSLSASYYESVWREMGEELGYVADDLDRQQITEADLPGAFEEWKAKGRAHLRHHAPAKWIFQALPEPIDLGDGATLYLPASGRGHARPDQTAAPDEMDRIGDLISRADRAEFDAERLDDADLPEQAAHLRQQAADLRGQADQLAHEGGHGSLYDDTDTDDPAVSADDMDLSRATAVPTDQERDRVDDDDADTAARDDADAWKDPKQAQRTDAAEATDTAAGDEVDLDALGWRSGEQQFEDWMDQEAASADEQRYQQALAEWKRTCAELPPGADMPAHPDPDLAALDAEEARNAAGHADRATNHAPQHDRSTLDNRSERGQAKIQEQQAGEATDRKPGPVKDDAGVADPSNDADSTTAAESLETAPAAATETTACAIAVTRAQCAIDRAHQQLDSAEQESAAERDDELARWHADDTAVHIQNTQPADHRAADEPALGE